MIDENPILEAKFTITTLGLIDFPFSLFVYREVLGQRFEISIGGCKGALLTPRLIPDIDEKSFSGAFASQLMISPISMPSYISNIKNEWGKPFRFPDLLSSVNKAVLAFEIMADEIDEKAQDIFADIDRWCDIFYKYTILMTNSKVLFKEGAEIRNRSQLRLVSDCANPTEFSDKRPLNLSFVMRDEASCLDYSAFQKICMWASQDKDIDLELLLYISAYEALIAKDYRKAIVESASATEICLWKCIAHKQNRIYTNSMNKEMTLGRLIKTAQQISIDISDYQLYQKIAKPRNDVMHHGCPGNFKVAGDAFQETGRFLMRQYPQYVEQSQ
jgi:hypothetical protein